MSILKKMAMLTSGVVVIMSVMTYFIILPTIQDIQGINDSIQRERIDLEKKYLRGQLLNKTIDDFDRVKDRKGLLMTAFIIEGEELAFITQLEQIAEQNQVTQSLKLATEERRQPSNRTYSVLPLTIELTAPFTQTVNYLHDVETLPFYINTGSISISNNGSDQLNTTMTATVYMLQKTTE